VETLFFAVFAVLQNGAEPASSPTTSPRRWFRPIRHVLITKTDMDIGKLEEW
jgi:hypothetical protein